MYWNLMETVLSDSDIESFLEHYRQGAKRLTQAQGVKNFEADWSEWQGCTYSTFVNSGSSADLLMMDAVKEYYKIPDGAEVLVPAVTWSTNINSVIQTKLKPVFVDVNLHDLSFNYDVLENHITQKTRILLITHLIGIPANIQVLRSIAKKYNLVILEDCCESHGAEIEGKKVGNFGDASTFSYYWGHHITTIEGGMVCTNNEDLNDLFKLKRSHGLARELDPSKHEEYRKKHPDIDFNFLFLTTGYNFRNTEFHAFLGSDQVKKLDEYIAIRNVNYNKFNEILDIIGDKVFKFDVPGMSSFCLPFIFKDKTDREKLQAEFQKHEIEYRPIIGGNLLRHPCFAYYGNYTHFKNAEVIHNNGVYIGNNQFVNNERLELLNEIIIQLFS